MNKKQTLTKRDRDLVSDRETESDGEMEKSEASKSDTQTRKNYKTTHRQKIRLVIENRKRDRDQQS